MGWLYDLNRTGIIIAFAGVAELAAILLYFRMDRMVRRVNL